MPPFHRSRALAAVAAFQLLLACDRPRPLASSGDSCDQCHGGNGSAAPPWSAHGETATTDRGVGAHRAHVDDGPIRSAMSCRECHVVPDHVKDHMTSPDGRAIVTFPPDGLARHAGATPAWEPDYPEGPRCSGVYCHGATMNSGGQHTAPIWTRVDASQITCDSCHGYPPATQFHPQGDVARNCYGCHSATVRPDGTIDVAGGHHVDGKIDAPSGGACNACHAAPPATGAHARHATPPSLEDVAYGSLARLSDVATSGDAYYFGCGHCHPLDAAKHMDGTIEVDLSPAGAPDGSLKARGASGAAWDAAGATCSGVYCHSSGQAAPVYATTPAWTAPPGTLGCGGCHGNPPRYATGGAGAPDANGHIGLAPDNGVLYEWGHFTGLPGPWHSSKHGGGTWGPGEDAAPITCQTCHADTVDPTATGPSGFYWLDTTGDYQLEGGHSAISCAAAGCHGDGDRSPTGKGRVLPLRHVDGAREVAFDRRPDLPDLSFLPQPPDRPTRPYWVTHAATGIVFPTPDIPDAVMDGATLSLRLEGAGYDPATKTCSNVACHLLERQVVWGTPHNGYESCRGCHPF
ncbi:CxxxxCH/CxxCH domain c-type cytochrome [Anaeromyxobacter oryzae]|uniref:Cytochrome C family protein n=1 Tax=Anaeromyxobacter oryzae TaxID=2918170 RepID=A0ABN6MU02_9BACT|nr:CxxxxCH/CxxCH domain-containing protein [Anaeromyxobacter oryzae]BDG03775.1 hypothetical protein AMOR_27710 [Anaeromyxobacter oryzae]